MEEQIRFDASSRVAFLMSNDKTNCALTGFDTSMPNHAVYQAIIEGITYRVKEVAEGIEKRSALPARPSTAGAAVPAPPNGSSSNPTSCKRRCGVC